MTTVAAIIERSLRLIGCHDPGEPLEPTDASTGIEAMNAMCTRWEANGQSLGWSNVSNPSQEMPSPPELDSCIAFNLALEVAPEYDVQPSVIVMTRAGEFVADLRRDNEVATPIQPILDVPIPTGGGAYRLGWPGDWYS